MPATRRLLVLLSLVAIQSTGVVGFAGLGRSSSTVLRGAGARRSSALCAARAGRGSGAAGGDDNGPADLDDFVEVNGLSLSEELSRASLMHSFDAAAEADRLRLTWAIRDATADCEANDRDCGDTCVECEGTGEKVCRYCRGTGFFTIADELIGSGNDCPVCKAKGYERCLPCQGTGAIAKWQNLRLNANKGGGRFPRR